MFQKIRDFLSRQKQKYRDLLSRAAWTAAQAGVSLVTVEALGLPTWLAAPVAMGLSAVKSWLATKVGNPETVTFDSPPPEVW